MQMTRRRERPEACLTQQGEAREPAKAERSWHDARAALHTDVKCTTSSSAPPSRPPATAALIRRRHLERELNAGVFHVKHSFAFPRSAARLEGHSQPASRLGALHAPAPPRSSTAPRPDTPASLPHRVMAPTPDSRHAPPSRHHRAARRRTASPLAAAAASVALAAADPVVPAAPAAALPRGPVLAHPPRLAPPRFRAARTPPAPAAHVAGAARREPRRAVLIVTHRSTPMPARRARTRHSRRPTVPAPDTRAASVMPYMSAPPRRIPQPHRSHPQGRMPVVRHLHLDPTRECFT